MTIEIQISSLMENAETAPLHLTLEVEGLEDQKSLNEGTNLYGVLYGMQRIDE